MRILKSLALAAAGAAMSFALLPETRPPGGTTGPALEMDNLFCGDLFSSDLTQVPGTISEVITLHPTWMTAALYNNWLTPFLAGQHVPRTVKVLQVGPGGVISSAAEFLRVVPQEVGLPTLDAASKDPAKWTVKFSAPTARLTTPNTKVAPTPMVKPAPAVISNFRVAIDGIDCSRVSKVDAITIKPRTGPHAAEAGRTSPKTGPMTVSNLVIQISSANDTPFRDWMMTTSKQLKNGSITLLKPNQTPWGTLTLQGLAIAKVETVSTSHADQIKRTRIEMSVDGVQFTYVP